MAMASGCLAKPLLHGRVLPLVCGVVFNISTGSPLEVTAQTVTIDNHLDSCNTGAQLLALVRQCCVVSLLAPETLFSGQGSPSVPRMFSWVGREPQVPTNGFFVSGKAKEAWPAKAPKA